MANGTLRLEPAWLRGVPGACLAVAFLACATSGLAVSSEDASRAFGKDSEVTGFKPPVWDENAPAEAWISADTYEWTPHSPQRERPIATTRVKAGEGWKQFAAPSCSMARKSTDQIDGVPGRR